LAKDIRELKRYIVENVEEFRSANRAFGKDFQTQNEIIRRYDEVLAQKAAKHTVQVGLEESDARLQAKIQEVTDMIGDAKHEVKSHAARLQRLREEFGEEVEARIARGLKKERMRSSAKPAGNPGDILQGEGAAHLKKLLTLKADKADVE